MEKCFIGQDGQQLPPVLQEIKLHLYIFTIDDKFFQANICIFFTPLKSVAYCNATVKEGAVRYSLFQPLIKYRDINIQLDGPFPSAVDIGIIKPDRAC
jgi:hypothetical protein